MRQLIIFLAPLVFLFNSCKSQHMEKEKLNTAEREKAIRTYYSGWEQKSWDLIEKQLADDFTFTSPNNDDHLPIKKFKDKCWGQADHIQKFELIRFAEIETGCYVTYKHFTSEN